MASSPQTTPAPTRTASESSWAASRGPVPPHAHAHGRCPVTGAESHDYCPPQADDSRSPCPALNTLANHGYLPRDGKCITPAVLVHALRAGYHLSLPLAWFLTHGGFYLLGQRRKRICLRDLSRHNCIEHNASLVHPDVAYRDEYAPVDVHLHMLEDLLRYSTDGALMTPDDVARVRVVREAAYAVPMDKVHAEIARGEMAIVLQLFNNPDNLSPPAPRAPLLTRIRRVFAPQPPAPPPPAPLPGVPNHMLRVWMHEERLPDGWTPYHRVGLLHTIRMATRLRRSMRALHTEQRKAGRTRSKTIDGAVAALIPALTIATPDAEARRPSVVVETGDVGGEPLADERANKTTVDSPTALDTPRSTMTRNSTLASSASSDGLRTPLDVPLPAPALSGGGVKESVYPVREEEEGILDMIRERARMIEVVE
ncbi:uncharacterized protein B0H18DRAFT_335618 [Fomitopsis serialis]|uniref:uncharacterized protein n=1 Tax=Fomitopsis serialis TaxID=139415 RepID=UPI0020086F71|nr:uncharacterized protein B0H18DRAFT_335618 [Neoantrodia serialis]KAH9911664.1 hypothetical protein B0H18DRAFT_335618 [Neoantrodia serialis]